MKNRRNPKGPTDLQNPVSEDLKSESGRLENISVRGSLELLSSNKQLGGTKEERTDHNKALEEQLTFEMLLSETSTRFVNLPADRIDGEIEFAQRRICECLDLDLSALWQWTPETPPFLTQTHLYRTIAGPPLPERIDAQDLFPWCLQQLTDGKLIAVSTEGVPPEAARDQEVWRHYGIKSTIVLPLSAGGEPILGVLGFGTLREERVWPESLVKRLKLVAQIFTNALVRKCSEEHLRESEARLSLATAAAGAGLWSMEIGTGNVWASGKIRELFNFAPDQELNYESFSNSMHAEDRELVDKAVQQALQSGEDLNVEYRIVLPDGNIRWIGARGKQYPDRVRDPIRLMGIALDITQRKQMENQLKEQLRKIEELKQKIEIENIYLQQEIKLLSEHTQIVAQSSAMKRVLHQAQQVARSESTVLITGETGTGKELVARAIHGLSSRKNRPLFTINCSSLPPTLIESELFGREKGAYTGALTKMAGRFEIANGSSLFLDEIGELPYEIQSKLLRVLETGTFERLGSPKSIRVDVRIIAATNRDLEHEMKEGRFRKDLFYRLNVFPIVIPPLRRRPEDIPAIVWTFIRQFQKRMGKEIETVPKNTMDALQSYSWPGNVRELKNVIERTMILCKGKTLVVDIPKLSSPEEDALSTLKDMERKHIAAILERTGWRISGKNGAAEILGLKRPTLYRRIKELGIIRPGV